MAEPIVSRMARDGRSWPACRTSVSRRTSAFFGVVGVERGHRPFVAGVHRLEHVQGFAATALTHDDAVGAHTQTAFDELSNRDSALAFDVRRARLELDPVRLLKLKLRRVLAGDQPLCLRNE